MGRLDFKSSLRRSDPAAGEFDSHTLPPNEDIKQIESYVFCLC